MPEAVHHASRRPWTPGLRYLGSGWGAIAVAIAIAAPPASGHALLHRVLDTEGTVRIEFHFPDGDRPYFETYRVLAPDDHQPFQTGRVNAAGEVIFRPDRPGSWRVLVATEDGHGAEIRLEVDPETLRVGRPRTDGLPQAERLTAGIGYLLGVFGTIALWRARRVRNARP